MLKRARRSVTLDSEQVRYTAKALGIHSPATLNNAILKNRNDIDGRATKIGNNAWNDRPLDRKSADEVAQVLQVADYRLLLNVSPSSFWSQLRCREDHHEDILEIVLKSEVNRRHLFTLGEAEKSDVWKINKDDGWYLKLNYKKGYYLLVLIRDKSRHVVITPSHYGFPQHFETNVVTIPEANKWLNFDPDEKADWREVIVIACRQAIFPIMNEKDNYDLGHTARERIAAKLLDTSCKGDYVVDSIMFELVEPTHA